MTGRIGEGLRPAIAIIVIITATIYSSIITAGPPGGGGGDGGGGAAAAGMLGRELSLAPAADDGPPSPHHHHGSWASSLRWHVLVQALVHMVLAGDSECVTHNRTSVTTATGYARHYVLDFFFSPICFRLFSL